MLPPYNKLNVRGHISIVQLKDLCDEDSYLLIYYDSKSKFVHLRPIHSSTVPEISMELAKIFLVFGAPNILQSDERMDFLLKIIIKVNILWPVCKMLYSHTQLKHRGIDSAFVKSMLQSWIMLNGKENWALGCYFVQMQINSSVNEDLGCSAHCAMFGTELRTGLANLGLSPEDVQQLVAVEDFEVLYRMRYDGEALDGPDPEFGAVVDLPTGSLGLQAENMISSGKFFLQKAWSTLGLDLFSVCFVLITAKMIVEVFTHLLLPSIYTRAYIFTSPITLVK